MANQHIDPQKEVWSRLNLKRKPRREKSRKEKKGKRNAKRRIRREEKSENAAIVNEMSVTRATVAAAAVATSIGMMLAMTMKTVIGTNAEVIEIVVMIVAVMTMTAADIMTTEMTAVGMTMTVVMIEAGNERTLAMIVAEIKMTLARTVVENEMMFAMSVGEIEMMFAMTGVGIKMILAVTEVGMKMTRAKHAIEGGTMMILRKSAGAVATEDATTMSMISQTTMIKGIEKEVVLKTMNAMSLAVGVEAIGIVATTSKTILTIAMMLRIVEIPDVVNEFL